MAGGPPLRSAAALAVVPGAERTEVAARLALAGHVTRQVERETFSVARAFSLVVEERLRSTGGEWPAPAIAVAAELADPTALKRCWVYGFYVACCEECPSAGA